MTDSIIQKKSKKNEELEKYKISKQIEEEEDDDEENDEDFVLDENELFMNEDDDIDIGSILENLFTEPKRNKNIAEILLDIKKGIDMHNQLIQKLLLTVLKK